MEELRGCPSTRARKVLMGTCGWSDDTLLKCRKFYPASVRTSEDRLRHYSTHFPCVEVDTSTYAIPSTASITGWLRCVPKGFIFHFKAFGLFCSKSCPFMALPSSVRSKLSVPCIGKDYVTLGTLSESLRDEIWQIFNTRLCIAHDNGSLGVVVFQFHLSFKPTKENQAHVEWCRQNLDSRFSMAVEFRSREWFTGQHLLSTLKWLEKCRITLVSADELEHETFQKDRHQTGLPKGQKRATLPVAWSVTQPDFVYIRVHRREGTERLLSGLELSFWENRLKMGLSPDLKGPVYFMWGTDWEDQPILNAKALTERLKDMAFDWKLAQQEFSSRKCLERFFKIQVEKKSPVEQSCKVPSKSFSPCKADERNATLVYDKQMTQWHCQNSCNSDEVGRIPTKNELVTLNIETATTKAVATSAQNLVASAPELAVKRKGNKRIKQGNSVMSRNSVSAITMYFK